MCFADKKQKMQEKFTFFNDFYGTDPITAIIKKTYKNPEIKDILVSELPEFIKSNHSPIDCNFYHWNDKISALIRKEINLMDFFTRFEESCHFCKSKKSFSEFDITCKKCYGTHLRLSMAPSGSSGDSTRGNDCLHCKFFWWEQID